MCLAYVCGASVFYCRYGQGGHMLRSLRNCLRTRLKASSSAAEDRTEAHLCFYNVVLLSFYFIISVPLLSVDEFVMKEKEKCTYSMVKRIECYYVCFWWRCIG